MEDCARGISLALLAPSPLEPRATGRLKLPAVQFRVPFQHTSWICWTQEDLVVVAVFMAPGLMLPSKSVFGRTRVVLGLLKRFLSVYVVIRVECLFVYYVVSMCMHFFLITPSPCVRAAPHVTASGEAPRSGSGGSRSLGDLPNYPSPTHLMSDLRGRQTVTTDQTTPPGL